MMTDLEPKKGILLIAEPSLTGDVSFNRSVVLLAEHNEEGSIGFILNKPLDYNINELVTEIHIPFRVYNGGPVEQDNLYFIHNVPHLIENSIEISDGIYWGGDFEKTITLINDKIISEKDIRFFLGYSGWASLQLDEELSSKSWIMVKNEYESAIINKPSTAFWKEKMMELGGSYLLWSNAPENPNLN
jgi:putative transcriptional regulator